MIRIAACGDVHFDKNSAGRLEEHFYKLEMKADLLVIAGDLTQTGHPDEMKALASDLKNCPVPVVAVFGNHDYHMDKLEECASILGSQGVVVLDNGATIIDVNGLQVGVAGGKGFGGGFVGACGSDFGEKEMKDFMRHSRSRPSKLSSV